MTDRKLFFLDKVSIYPISITGLKQKQAEELAVKIRKFFN